MIQFLCQIVWLLLLTVALFSSVQDDIRGEAAKPPRGYTGVAHTLIVYAAILMLLYGAGAFSTLFHLGAR